MIYIRNKNFNLPYYNKFFSEFTHLKLNRFQKWAIKAIIDRDHAFISSNSNPDKTLPAEFVIHHLFLSSINNPTNKKIIFISPSKSLSKVAFHNFNLRFPNLSIQLVTNDIKELPDANLLIMTIDLFRSILFNQFINSNTPTSSPNINIDFSTDIATIIFDDIHFITDPKYGSIWEQSIIMIPDNIQLLLLSININKPFDFVNWISKLNCCLHKNIYLIPNDLSPTNTHSLWLNCKSSIHSNFKDKNFLNLTNNLITLKDTETNLYRQNYLYISQLQYLLSKNHLIPSYKLCLHSLISHLKDNNFLPAICFCYSKDTVQTYANSISINLYPELPPIEDICYDILQSKISNFREYINLPEYNYLISLFKKGIAIHHFHMIPILRELVEIILSKGYIKLLFTADTFCTSINMPTKTVIFSSLYTSHNNSSRLLEPYQYALITSKAGTHDANSPGHIIHCNSLFKPPEYIDIKTMLNGSALTISSNFFFSYHFILNILSSNKLNFDNITQFINKTLLQMDIDNDIKRYTKSIFTTKNLIDDKTNTIHSLNIPFSTFDDYIELNNKSALSINKNNKTILKKIHDIETQYPNIINHLSIYKCLLTLQNNLDYYQYALNKANVYTYKLITSYINMLSNIHFINHNPNSGCFELTNYGIFASQIIETNGLILSILINKYSLINELYTYEIAALLSCFTNISIPHDKQIYRPNTPNYQLNNVCLKLQDIIDIIKDAEYNYGTFSSDNYSIHYDLLYFVIEWCSAKNDTQCQLILNNVNASSISTSDFIKAIFKIYNIVNELCRACKLINNTHLLNKLNEIPPLLFKHIITEQSLYI